MKKSNRLTAVIISLILVLSSVGFDVYSANDAVESTLEDNGYECINLSGNPVNTVYYGEVDAYRSVIWDVSKFSSKGNSVRLKYSLPKKIAPTDGPFTIDVSMKLLGGTFAMNGFPSFSGTVFGMYQWSNTDRYRLAANNNAYIANEWGKTVDNFTERFTLKSDDLKNGFYTFRYVIYPHIGSDSSNGFRFYYKNDIDGHWYEPYGEYKLSDNLPKGILPAGTLPAKLEYLNFDARLLQDAQPDNNLKTAFKKIEVNQGLKCVSSNVNSGGMLTKQYFELSFNYDVDIATVNEKTLGITRDGLKLTLNTDYTLSQPDGTSVRINFAETSPGSKYSVTLNGINNRDYLAKLDGELQFDFTSGSEKELADMYSDGIFVSTSGNNSGNGTINAPLADIESAIAKWKEVTAQTDINPAIYLRGGEYRPTDSINLDSSVSGITISGYNDEVAVLNGAYKIDSNRIRNARVSDCGGRLNAAKINNIVRIDLSHIDGLYRSDNINISDCELLNNGVIQNIASWPDKGSWDYTGEVTANDDGTYTFISSKDKFWDLSADDVMIEGYWYADYQFERGRVLSFDGDSGEITVLQDQDKFSSDRRYRIYNLPEEIDRPGEYYINYKEKAAYLMTDGGIQNDIEITGTPDGIFNIVSDADNISIKNLTVKNTRGTGINIYNCSNISVTDCYVYNTGGNGLTATASRDCTVDGSYFANNGGISVKLDGGDIPSLTGANYVVRDCEFENGGRLVKTYSPFVYTSGVGFEIVNNRFYNHPHSAILFYGCDNVIKNNVFEKIATETEDVGAVYSRVNPTYRGNVISNNIFRNIRSFKSEPEYADVFGVYIDDLLQDVTVSENLFVDCQSPFNFGGGRSNRFIGNAVYNTYEGGGYLTRSNAVKDSLKANNGYMWMFVNNLRSSSGYDEEKWFARYPNYKSFVADLNKQNTDAANTDASVIKGGEICNNVFVSPNAEKNKFINVASVVSQNGNVSDNYQSSSMVDMTVDGSAVEYCTAIKQLGYSEPDVSAAGILTEKPHKPLTKDDETVTKNLSYRGLGISCDGYRSGAAAESYYDGLLSYAPFGTASLTADSVGGEKCLRFSHGKADFVYKNYFSYVFHPLLPSQQTIDFETSIMLESAESGNVGFMEIQGYDSSNEELSVTVAKGEYNCTDKKLTYAGEDIPLENGEITNGFVRIKVSLDSQNSKITVYKSTDGVYAKLFEKSVAYIPEYIDRVKYYISNVQNTADAVCWFDNINVSLSKCAAAFDSYGGSEIANFGDYTKDTFCIRFNPQSGYPKLCNIVAVYSSDGTLSDVIMLGTANAVNLAKSSFGDGFYFKCFQFRSLKSCAPLSGCALIK